MADDDGRPAARPRPPMPPVPPPLASRQPAATVTAGPTATALDERRPAASLLQDIPTPAGPPRVSQPVPELPSRALSSWSLDDHEAPWSTGRGEIRAPRGAVGRPESTPFVERRSSRLPVGGVRPTTGPGEAPAYGDWTKPSGPGRVAASAPVPPLPAVPSAPRTSMIPDRDVAGRRGGSVDLDDRYDDEGTAGDPYEDDRHDDGYADDEHDRAADLDDSDSATPGPVTGTVVGGRAALRAEREAREASRVAAEAARRKAAGELDDDVRPRRPRRMVKALVAVAAVAAGVAGYYTVTSPGTQETSVSSSPSTHTPAPIAPTSAPAVTAALPPLDTEPSVSEAAPATPVRVPVTVLNSTEITGLAAGISKEIEGGDGWETTKPGGYPNEDVAASTVFFTRGDEKQRQAALQLVDEFPQLSGPAERFFEVPDEVDAPGLVVVVTGDWTP